MGSISGDMGSETGSLSMRKNMVCGCGFFLKATQIAAKLVPPIGSFRVSKLVQRRLTLKAMTTILEGLWEEIEARADELRGKRVQVRVLTDAPRHEASEEDSLATLLSGRIGVIKGTPTDASERTEEIWGQSVEEEYRRSQK